MNGNLDKYNKIIDDTIDKCVNTLERKHNEYADDKDDFKNFRVSANLLDIPLTTALGGMMAKHTSSVYDLIKNKETNLEVWDEKICDHINYLLILRAMVELEGFAEDDF